MRRRWQRDLDREDYAKVLEREARQHSYSPETAPPEDPGPEPEPPRVSDVGGGSQK